MRIKLWGVRGSIPTPLSPQIIREKITSILTDAKGVDLSNPLELRKYLDELSPLTLGTAGGNTPCVEIQADGHTLIIDAGSGLRALGQELMLGPCGRGRGTVHLFLSHTHWDHIQGLPFFRPAFVPGNRIYIYSIHDVKAALISQMEPATFPITFSAMQKLSQVEFRQLKEGEALEIGSTKIKHLRLPHPGGAYAYRFEDAHGVFVYASDAEYKKLDEQSLQPYISFYQQADVLLFDAQFTLRESIIREDWGHSSALIGADMARRAKIKHLVLFHHDPLSSDQDLLSIVAQTQAYQAAHEDGHQFQITAAYEGLTIDLSPSRIFKLQRSPDNDSIVVTLNDGFDQHTLLDAWRQITSGEDTTASKQPKLIVDMAQVTRMDTSTLRALIDLRQQREGPPIALAGLQAQVKQIIEIIGYGDFFPTYPSIQAALDALSAHEKLGLPGNLIKKRYRIETQLGESQTGIFFKATDLRLNRLVTIKIFSPSLSPKIVRRILQNAQQVARLQVASQLDIYDSDEEWGLSYLVMQYVGDHTLRHVMQQTTLPSLELIIRLVQALETVHAKEVVHGNLKPENIFIAAEVKLTDFGQVWLDEGQALAELPIMLDSSNYLAPEQILGQPIDKRTDLYALGICLYELFTGQLPFGGTPQQVSEKHLSAQPISPRELKPTLSRSLEYLILKLLAKDPAQRYETAAQVRHVLMSLESLTAASDAPSGFVAARSPRSRPLIGQKRAAQLKQMLEWWQAAQQSQGQVVLVAGEAGVGKTHLSQELATQATNGQVCIGHCSDLEGQSAYQPFVEIIRNYLAHTPVEDARQHLGDAAIVLVNLVPEIHALFPSLTESKGVEAEQARTRLWHAFTDFARRAATAQPLLLILDDLHWADSASLQLFHYLARHVASLPLLLVGTYRQVELDSEHPLRGLLQSLSRYPFYHLLTLDRLDEDGVRKLLESIWSSANIPDEWIGLIHKRTGGNPFYVEEFARNFTDEGLVTLQNGAWRFEALGETKFPQSIQDIVLRRVARTRPATQDALRQAAILGQQFRFDDLHTLVDQAEEQLLESLDEALQRDLVREVDGGDLLAFSHEEVQQIIYTNMSALWRRKLHREAGQKLAQKHAKHLAPVAGHIANHLIQAGDHEPAIVYGVQAARYAVANKTFLAAEKWYGQVLSLLPTTAATLHQRAELLQELGDLQLQQAHTAEALKAYSALRTVAEVQGDLKAQARAWDALAQTQWIQGQYGVALRSAEQAEKLARSGDESLPIMLSALCQQGQLWLKLGDCDKATALGEQALTQSSALNHRQLMATALNLLGSIRLHTGPFEQATAYHERALQLYRESGQPAGVIATLSKLGMVAHTRGDWDTAMVRYQECLALTREVGHNLLQRTVMIQIAALQLAQADLPSAESSLTQAIHLTPAEDSFVLALIHKQTADLRLAQARFAEALHEAHQALAAAEASGDLELSGGAWRALGWVAMQTGTHVLVGDETYTPDACFAASFHAFTLIHKEVERANTLSAWARYELTNGNAERGNTMREEARAILTRLGVAYQL